MQWRKNMGELEIIIRHVDWMLSLNFLFSSLSWEESLSGVLFFAFSAFFDLLFCFGFQCWSGGFSIPATTCRLLRNPPEQGGGKRAPLQPPEDRMGNGVFAFDFLGRRKCPLCWDEVSGAGQFTCSLWGELSGDWRTTSWRSLLYGISLGFMGALVWRWEGFWVLLSLWFHGQWFGLYGGISWRQI